MYEGFDHFGSIEMKEFSGPAVVEYDGGAGAIERIRKARNGRYCWFNIANSYNPYIFTSFKESIKIQSKMGGKIIPADVETEIF